MQSNSKKARGIVRSEIRSHYSPNVVGSGRSTLANMKADAESAYTPGRDVNSDYGKGAKLVDRGAFASSRNDKRKMLGKIYGQKRVEEWSGDKVHNTYKHLIGREYASMLREHENRKPMPRKISRKGRW